MQTVMRPFAMSRTCGLARPSLPYHPVLIATAHRPVLRWHHAFEAHSGLQKQREKRHITCLNATAAHGLSCEPWTGAPEQVQALEELKRLMSAGPNGVPDEETLKWFLRDRYFIVQDAADKLNSMLAWRNAFQPGPVDFPTIAAEHATGKSYVHEHLDRYDRPAIVITARHHVTGAFPAADSKRLCVYTIDSAISKLPPGKEQIIGVFDLRSFETKNMDLTFIKFLIDAFFEYYPKRVGQVLFVDAPWVFQPAWQVIKPLMRKYAALVQFVSSEQVVREVFTPETAPQQFV